MSTTKLHPSYYGYVGSTKDALLIIQQIIDKNLNLVTRRPNERERPSLIKSGNVFVFIEEHSGIKRWTDGIAWSPSRILGRFLVYRELDKQSLNEKDDKKNKKKRRLNDPTNDPNNSSIIPPATHLLDEQAKIGSKSMVSSYVFKDHGLIKKTLSLTTKSKELHVDKKGEKQTIHLISYYNAEDVISGKLQRPSETELKNIQISSSLWNAVKDTSLGGKIPIEDEAYYFLDNNYQLQNMSSLQQHPFQNAASQQQRKHSGPPQTSQPPRLMQYIPPVDSYPRHNSLPQSSHHPHHLQHQQYMLPVVNQSQPFQQFENSKSKREDDLQSNTIPELTFTNPFTGGIHTNNNNSSSSSSYPLFNNYMVPPQSYTHDTATGSSSTGNSGRLPPYLHYQQPMFQQPNFSGNNEFGNTASTLNSNTSNIDNVSSGSVSSVNSSMLYGNGPGSTTNSSNTNNTASTPTSKKYQPNNNGWFTTTANSNSYIHNDGDGHLNYGMSNPQGGFHSSQQLPQFSHPLSNSITSSTDEANATSTSGSTNAPVSAAPPATSANFGYANH